MKRTISPISLNNLIQFGSEDMPPEVHRALSAAGGRASGESRRHKAELRERVEDVLAVQILGDDIRTELKEFRRWRKRKIAMERKREQSKIKAAENRKN